MHSQIDFGRINFLDGEAHWREFFIWNQLYVNMIPYPYMHMIFSLEKVSSYLINPQSFLSS